MSHYYDPSEAMLELLDRLPSDLRKELLEEARPAPIPIRQVTDFYRRTGHTLVSDLDHRTLETETEGSFKWLDNLSHLNRQLEQEGDLRVEIREGKVVKIVKKRDPEFLQPVDTEPREEEDGEAELIPAEFCPPKDKWDLIFDATPLIKAASVKARTINSLPPKERECCLQSMANELVYSADFFPYHRSQSSYRDDVKQMLEKIRDRSVSKEELIRFCSRQEDRRPVYIRELKRKALRLPKGRSKAQLLLKAQKLNEDRSNQLRAAVATHKRLEIERSSLLAARSEILKTQKDSNDRMLLRQEIEETQLIIRQLEKQLSLKQRSPQYSSSISVSEKKALWDAWVESQAAISPVKVSRKRFQRMLTGKLNFTVLALEAEKLSKELTGDKLKDALQTLRNKVRRQINTMVEKVYGR